MSSHSPQSRYRLHDGVVGGRVEMDLQVSDVLIIHWGLYREQVRKEMKFKDLLYCKKSTVYDYVHLEIIQQSV